jgi:serpin B
MTRSAAPSEPAVEFQADHPFLFLIQHRDTGMILFLGRFADPKGS